MPKEMSRGGRILSFLRLDTEDSANRTCLTIIVGVFSYMLLYAVELPEYKALGLITVQISLALLVIPLVAAFFGPFAGFVVGLFGTLIADLLYTQQIIALGLINLSYGLLGLIVGIPHYNQGEGFSRGRTLGKLILFTMAGFLVMIVFYLAGLLLIVGENFLSAILYNFLPFFSVSLITLLIVAPVAVRLAGIVASYTRERLQ
ncbi:MAG: ECF transporter S component [Candidatus Atabeyarchaeum deiterrae]